MLKQNKKTILFTNLIMLLPTLAGLLLWKQLPDQIPCHWNMEGVADSWCSRSAAVFGFPLLCFAIYWFGILAMRLDPKHKNMHTKPLLLALWVCPAISILCSVAMYLEALNYHLPIEKVIIAFLGILFVVIGNYMPKCRQSYTMGIKLPWTLDSEENWNATHRMASRVWVIGGIALILTCWLGSFPLFFGITLAIVLIPTVYSYLFYKKQQDNT